MFFIYQTEDLDLDSEEGNQDYKNTLFSKFIDQSAPHKHAKMMNKLVILNSKTLEQEKEIILDGKIERIRRLELLWDSQVLFIAKSSDANNGSYEHLFFNIMDELQLNLNEPQFELFEYSAKQFQFIEPFQLFFRESQLKKIYILKVNEKQIKLGKSKTQTQLDLLCFHCFQPRQKGEVVKTFSQTQIKSINEVHVNNNFSQLFIIGFNEQPTAIMISAKDVLLADKKQTITSVEHQDIEISRHSFLQEHIQGVYRDHDGGRSVFDLRKDELTHFDSAFKSSNFTSFDITFQKKKKSTVEVVLSSKRTLKVCFYKKQGGNQQKLIQKVTRISEMSLNYPYISYFKGNSQLTIKNLHKPKEEIEVPLKQDQAFICFLDTQQEKNFWSKPVQETEFYHESFGKSMRPEDIERYQKMKKLDRVDISFLVLNFESKYEIKTLRLFPYIPESCFIVESWSSNDTISSSRFQQMRDPCQAQCIEMKINRGEVKFTCPALFMQAKGQIFVTPFDQDAFPQCEYDCNSNIRAIPIDEGGQREYFFVQDLKHSSAIKIISTKGEQNIELASSVYDDRVNKILSMVKRENCIFILTENLIMKQFKIVPKENSRSTLEVIHTLECSPRTREQILKHKEQLFRNFHRAHISALNVLHISGHFFRFYHDSTLLMQSISEEEFFNLDSYTGENLDEKLIQGPFSISDSIDSLAYFSQTPQGENFCVFKNCMSSKTNFLVNVECSYASFLNQEVFEFAEILVGIKGNFFIFRPNGEIEQEVHFLEAPTKEKRPWEDKILDVSDTLNYFVFEGIERVYELTEHERFFRPKRDIFRVPQEKEVIKKEGFESVRSQFDSLRKQKGFRKVVEEGIQAKYTGKVNPQPSMQRIVSFEDRHSDTINIHEDVIDGEVEEEKENTSVIYHYESQRYRYIQGTMEVGDEGSIWNLYFDTDEYKVYLRVNRDIREKLIPYRIQETCRESFQEKGHLPKMKMSLVENYLVMSIEIGEITEIYYLTVSQTDKTFGTPKKLNLDTRWDWKFIDLKKVDADHRIQVILQNSQTKITSILTWNLELNVEDRSLEIEENLDPVTKGVNSTLNFCNLPGFIYDLEYNFPLNFYGDNSKFNIKRNFFEATFTEGKDMIVMRDEKSLVVSLTLSLLEKRCIQKFYQILPKLKKKAFPISMTNFRTQQGKNIFHYLIEDFKALERFKNSYLKFIEQMDDEDERHKHLELFLLLLYPDKNGKSAFDLAIDKPIQFIDLILQALGEVPDYSLSKFVFRDLNIFKYLMSLKLASFENFLARCFYQNRTMKITVERYWRHGDKTEHIFSANTSLISSELLRHNVGRLETDRKYKHRIEKVEMDKQRIEQLRKKASIKVESKSKKKTDNLTCILRQSKFKEMEQLEEALEGEKKRINVSMVEFDWIFKGKEGQMFIDELIKTDSDEIFKVESVKISILFIWDFYYRKILLFVFLPQMLNFCCFQFYATFVTDGSMNFEDYCLGSICIAYSTYSLCYEIFQMARDGKDYFSGASITWNIIDLAASVFAMVATINDFADKGTQQSQREMFSLAVFFLWLKFFYFLRLFKPTAAFMRMIIEIVKDMGIFSLIYLLANLSIGNAFYILDGANNSASVEQKTYDGYLSTMMSIFLNGLGDFDTDNFGGHENEGFVWIYFIACTVLLTLVLLNLLIAIMGDTFDRVQEMKEEAMLRELCSLMRDNWLWLDQEKAFKDTKYICVAKLEQASSTHFSGWEGKIASLKNFFQSALQSQEISFKQIKQFQKEDIQTFQKNLKAQIKVQHHNLVKRSENMGSQVKALQKDMKQLAQSQQKILEYIEQEKMVKEQSQKISIQEVDEEDEFE